MLKVQRQSPASGYGSGTGVLTDLKQADIRISMARIKVDSRQANPERKPRLIYGKSVNQ